MKQGNVCIIFICLFLSACGNNPSPGRLMEQGNEAFNQAQYQDALQAYIEASDLRPDAGEPFYNMGNTLYRQQAYTNTQQLLTQSLVHFAENPEDELQQAWTQATHYNLGNTYFSQEEWSGAVEAYKEALRLTPDDQAAKYNLELALRRLQEEQEEQENQQGGDQDQQNSEDQQDQEQQDQSDQQDSSEDQSQPDQPESDDAPEQSQSQDDDQGEEQESDEEQAENQPQDEQSSEQSAEQSSEEGNDDSDASQQQAAQEQQPQEGLTIEQARQLVETVGENAETLQERLQQIYVAPNPPPEKDW